MLRRSRAAAASLSAVEPSPELSPALSSFPTQLTPLTMSKSYSSTSLTNYSPTSSRSSLSLELEEERKEHVSLSVEEVDASQLGLEMLVKM